MISLLGVANNEILTFSKEFSKEILVFASSKNIPVSVLNLSPKAKNTLRFNKIFTLKQLLEMDESVFSFLNMMDEHTASDIRFQLANYLEESKDEILSFHTVESKDASEEIDVHKLLSSEENRRKIIEALRITGQLTLLEGLNLSTRSFNCLKRAKKNDISGILELYPDGYVKIRNMGSKSIEELLRVAESFVQNHLPLIKAYLSGEDISTYSILQQQENRKGEDAVLDQISKEQLLVLLTNEKIQDLLMLPQTKEIIISYIAKNDIAIDGLDLSHRSYNALLLAGIKTLSEALAYYPDSFSKMKNVGAKSVQEIKTRVELYTDIKRQDYIFFATHLDNNDSIMETRSYPEIFLQEIVLNCFKGVYFKGLSYLNILEQCPQNVNEAQLKNVIGKLIQDKQLEYIDFRCYKHYPSIIETVEGSHLLDELHRIIFHRRINGETLESIGKDYGKTREWVRQKEASVIKKIRIVFKRKNNNEPFDEEYYKHLYTVYRVPQEFWRDYAGVSEQIPRLLSLLYDAGNVSLEAAIDDDELDVALKIRISEYLNRDQICLDDRMLPRNRKEIEDFVIRTYCQDEVSFEEFVDLYNNVLQKNHIAFDPDLYITEDVLVTRQNKISNSHVCLWKYGQKFRYYEIDSGDYEELYETLSLEDYQNTEVTTLKFMEEYPELMQKYDIRDQYELHNLIRKTADKSLYHNLDYQRQPTLRFGDFDRDAAIKDILAVFTPISAPELEEYLHSEYGYGISTIKMTYLKPFERYLVDGIYDMATPQMPPDRKALFERELTEDFYPIRRIIALYKRLFPDATEREVNLSALRDLGFKIYSEFAVRNYNSIEEYYIHVLTEHDISTIRDKLRRYSATSTFYSVYKRLKRQYDLFLFDHDQLITFHRLSQVGVTKEEVSAFSDLVYNMLDDGEYFTVHSLRKKGLSTTLDRLGFDDIFLTEILIEDPRYAYQRVFGTTVLCRNKEISNFDTRSFLYSLLSQYESIDIDDFVDSLKTDYGISEPNPYKIVELVRETSNTYYYDSIMKTIYRDKSNYLSEFDT